MKNIILVTGNKHKLEIANKVLSLYDINVINENIDVDEIQDTNIEEIAKKKCFISSKNSK